jgi:hypothetical protein
MPLCTICDELDLCNLTDWDNDLQDVPHHKSLASLKQSALTCKLCRLFFNGLAADQAMVATGCPEMADSPIMLRGRQYVDDESNQGGIYVLKARCDRARTRALFGLYVDEGLHPNQVLMSNSKTLNIRQVVLLLSLKK